MATFWQMAETLLEELAARIPQIEAAHARANGEPRAQLCEILGEARLYLELFGRNRRPGLRGLLAPKLTGALSRFWRCPRLPCPPCRRWRR
jgi:hypothetical protein